MWPLQGPHRRAFTTCLLPFSLTSVISPLSPTSSSSSQRARSQLVLAARHPPEGFIKKSGEAVATGEAERSLQPACGRNGGAELWLLCRPLLPAAPWPPRREPPGADEASAASGVASSTTATPEEDDASAAPLCAG